jgi:hypothetical protein
VDIDSLKLEMIFTRTKRQYWWLRAKNRALNLVGWGVEKLRTPAVLKEFEFVDPETNETIYLTTGQRYSVLHMRGKRLFFNRFTGVLDGTCTSLQERVANGIELGD